MTIQQTTIVLILFAVLALALFMSFRSPTVLGSTVEQGPYLQSATTSTAVAVTSSTRILATTTNSLGLGSSYTRIFATICNPSATLVYLNMNADKVADTSHAVAVIGAAAGYEACYEIGERNPYNGSVTASSTNQTSVSVIVTEYVK